MNDNAELWLGFLISDAARMLRTVFDRRVHQLGLTRAQWLVLARLHRRPGASQSELAEIMEVEKASAGRMIDRLERKGWVVRKADPIDRRINRLYLTPEAEKIRKRMWAVAEQTVDDAASDLRPDEVKQLTRLLLQVKGRLTTMAANGEPPPHPSGPIRKKAANGARKGVRANRADGTALVARGSTT